MTSARGRRTDPNGRKLSPAWVAALGFLGACTLPGVLLPVKPHLALLVAGAIVTFTAVVALGDFLPLLAVPGVILAFRLGGGGASSISIADVTLLLGAMAAIQRVAWDRVPQLRRFFGLIAAYQAFLLVVVVVHPTAPAILEWGHRLALLAGSLLVGAALVNQRRLRTALRLFLGLAAALAVMSMIDSAARGFAPAYPLGLHKNFAGNLLMMAVLLAYVLPSQTGIRRGLLPSLRILFLLGLLATQSRGSMVALFLGLLVWALRDHRLSLRTPLPYILGVLMLVFAISSLRSGPAASSPFSAVNSRLTFQQEALDSWHEEPIFGKGVRFYRGASSGLQSNPHNVVFETLAESGLVGALGLVVLMVGTVTWLRRIDTALGIAALVLMLSELTHGLFDIYWLAGSLSLPWIVVGMAVATAPAQAPPPADPRPNQIPVASVRPSG